MNGPIWCWKGQNSDGEVYRVNVTGGEGGEMFQVRIYGRWMGQYGIMARSKEIERGVYHTLREAKNRILDVVNR